MLTGARAGPREAREAAIFDAPLYGTFLGAAEVANEGFSPTSTRIVTFILIILMTVAAVVTRKGGLW